MSMRVDENYGFMKMCMCVCMFSFVYDFRKKKKKKKGGDCPMLIHAHAIVHFFNLSQDSMDVLGFHS